MIITQSDCTAKIHQIRIASIPRPGRSLKTAWLLTLVQTVDFHCPGVGRTQSDRLQWTVHQLKKLSLKVHSYYVAKLGCKVKSVCQPAQGVSSKFTLILHVNKPQTIFHQSHAVDKQLDNPPGLISGDWLTANQTVYFVKSEE